MAKPGSTEPAANAAVVADTLRRVDRGGNGQPLMIWTKSLAQTTPFPSLWGKPMAQLTHERLLNIANPEPRKTVKFLSRQWRDAPSARIRQIRPEVKSRKEDGREVRPADEA